MKYSFRAKFFESFFANPYADCLFHFFLLSAGSLGTEQDHRFSLALATALQFTNHYGETSKTIIKHSKYAR